MKRILILISFVVFAFLHNPVFSQDRSPDKEDVDVIEAKNNVLRLENPRIYGERRSAVLFNGRLHAFDSLSLLVTKHRIESVTIVRDQNEIGRYTDRKLSSLIVLQPRKDDE